MMQTGEMVKIAAQHPAKALVYINKALNELACLTKDSAVQAFDMEVEDSCVEVTILHCCGQPTKTSWTMRILLMSPHALHSPCFDTSHLCFCNV